MFMLYAVIAGVAVGLLARGRLGALADLRVRWAPLAVAALLLQVALFSAPVSAVIGSIGPPIYVGSTAAVLVVVLRNVRIPGLALVAIGAASNLAAIAANGGYMPASADALASLGASISAGYSNSSATAAPALAPLTDIFALPAWLPLANIFSIGDVLIGAGIACAIVVQMRAGPPGRSQPADDARAVRADTSLQRSGASVPWSHGG